MYNSTSNTVLSSFSIGSPFVYKLRDDRVVSYFLGFLPVRSIRLTEVRYLRLATHHEASLTYLILNWSSFLPRCRSVCPVYVLQTKGRARIFLKLKSDVHFKLRQAIGRASEQRRGKRGAWSKRRA